MRMLKRDGKRTKETVGGEGFVEFGSCDGREAGSKI
jgi:hypothetical protein